MIGHSDFVVESWIDRWPPSLLIHYAASGRNFSGLKESWGTDPEQ
jgi:hypothetical protein